MNEVTGSGYRAGVVGEGSRALGSGAAAVERAGGQLGCEERASDRQPRRHRTHGRAGDAPFARSAQEVSARSAATTSVCGEVRHGLIVTP